MTQSRITDKRRLVQLLLIAVALFLPFVSVSGNPFLRIDIAKMTFFLAGIPLRIDQFYLVLLVTLLSVLLFLLMTLVLGRIWCGWLCPQTVFNDLQDLISQRFRTKISPAAGKIIEHLAALIIAKMIAFNMFCWFMPPVEVARKLFDFRVHHFMIIAYILLTLFGYLNLILVKRSFCRSYCPYGRLQTAMMDAGTLNLAFLEETRSQCLHCNACVRTCPMDIDIRDGFQIECIGCGRCIDACRDVMEKMPHGSGLIDYRFGVVKGTRFKLGGTTMVLSGVTLLLLLFFIWGVSSRKQTAFAVQRVATSDVRKLPDGSVAQSWRAIIGNRSEAPHTYSIKLSGQTAGVELLGPISDINVAANQNKEIIFMIHVNQNSRNVGKMELKLISGDLQTASVIVAP
jgi:cytochrome c oxidase accessory protein FixG